MERDALIRAIQYDFSADCDFSVLLPDGRTLPIVGLVYGPNGDEDAVFITEGSNKEYMGEGAVIL